MQGQVEQARQALDRCCPPEEHTSAQYVDVADWIRPAAWKERLGADIHGARAQIALADKVWDLAEEEATKMMNKIEGSAPSRCAIILQCSHLVHQPQCIRFCCTPLRPP